MRARELEGGVFTHGCVTPPVSGDLQERSCCSLFLFCSDSLFVIAVLYFTVPEMNQVWAAELLFRLQLTIKDKCREKQVNRHIRR